MRITLTLDDDVSVLLEQVQARRRAMMKAAVNEALRIGLVQMSQPPKTRKPFRTKLLITGPPLIPLMDNTSELLALAEGEDYK